MTGTRKRARKGEGGELRDELLDAADALLTELGSQEAVSVRAITKRVGVTAPALYLHFADKDELLFEVCQRRFEAFGTAMMAALDGVVGAAEQVRALGRAYVTYAFANPQQYETMFGTGSIPIPPEFAEDPSGLPGWQALQVLVAVVAAGIEMGEFRDVSAEHAAIGLWSLVHGYVGVTRHLEEDLGGAMAPREAMEDVLDLVLSGLSRC